MVLTPIEKYQLNGKVVHVKRDDLIGDGIKYPRWAKIEGIRRIIESEYIDKSKPLTHLSVYGSWTGWVLSALCNEYGIEFISSYPDSKKYPKKLLEMVVKNGGKLNPMRPNMMKILENKLKSDAFDNGWQTLPYAFNHYTYINYMQERMVSVLETQDFDHLIISIGSGVTASGIIREFLKYDSWLDILKNKRQVHSITMSSISSTKRMLNHNGAGDLNNIHLYKSEFKFDDMMDWYEVPFDCNEFWDKKMWYWLERNIENLKGRILFWNIGGSYINSLKNK